VQLGRGVDYSFSATSADQDIVDTYAIKLCEPGGGQPTMDSMGYRWNGECLPIEVIEKTNVWTPNAADMTPPGTETLQAFRTNAGLITHRATVKGKPFAYTSLRATYKREVDAARSFADWNSPDVVTDAESWIKSAYKDDLTFNWFYTDSREVAYFNTGANPVRGKGVPVHFPVSAKPRFMWKNYDPELNTFKRQPIRKHAQVLDQRFLTSWNNKSALGIGCDSVKCYGYVAKDLSMSPGCLSCRELAPSLATAASGFVRKLICVTCSGGVVAAVRAQVRPQPQRTGSRLSRESGTRAAPARPPYSGAFRSS